MHTGYITIALLGMALASNAFIVPRASLLPRPPTPHYATTEESSAAIVDGKDDYKQLWKTDAAELDIVERSLLLHNFTINTYNQTTVLSAKRVYAHWDTFWYYERTWDVEMDDVELYIEFTKGVQQSNWNELNDEHFYEWAMADVADENELLHFNSVDLSGNLTVVVASRPLGKTLGSFTLNMDAMDELNTQIKALSDENLGVKGRKGCTSAEIFVLLKDFVFQQIKSYISL